MALQTTGPISLNDVQTEFGGTNPISISEYYDADSGVPAAGTISLSDFYGTSAADPFTWDAFIVGGGGGGGDASSEIGASKQTRGGGGAGGSCTLATGVAVQGVTWNITVGAGGLPASTSSVANSTGGTSSITGTAEGDWTAAGGGYGAVGGNGSGSDAGRAASNGGGGACSWNGSFTAGSLSPLGFSGGDGGQNVTCSQSSTGFVTGGGGAGAAGNGAPGGITGGQVDNNGAGGIGIKNDFSTLRLEGYGGGGAGGASGTCLSPDGSELTSARSVDGGGQSYTWFFYNGLNQLNQGSPGLPNTGGGGAGGTNLFSSQPTVFIPGVETPETGTAGGSGIVVIRVPQSITAVSTTGNPEIRQYSKGGVNYRSYTFKKSGTITW